MSTRMRMSMSKERRGKRERREHGEAQDEKKRGISNKQKMAEWP